MFRRSVFPLSLQMRINHALLQDGGVKGDVTTHAVISSTHRAHGQCIVKAKSGIISGLCVMQEVFATVNPAIRVKLTKHDGDKVKRGDIVAVLDGPARGILQGERVALEFIRHMSGIATTTGKFVEKVKGTGVTILDTRKTFPGFGDLDKQAVRDGGATNHRMNLSEMGLIKNNHIDVCGGDIATAVNQFRKAHPYIPLEVEVRNKQELAVTLRTHPDRILLDNMTIVQLRKAVRARDAYAAQTGEKIPLEASGNITIDCVRGVAKTGVEYISVGKLTHSTQSLDISLHITG